MTAAIAIPATTTPAAAALANGAASGKASHAAGEGFAAALASLLGNTTTPQAHAAPHAPKSQHATASSSSEVQTDPNAVVQAVPGLIVAPVAQMQTNGAVQTQQASATAQINAQATPGSALQVLQVAAGTSARAQTATTESADQTAAPQQPAQAPATAAFAALLANAQQPQQQQQLQQQQNAQAPAHTNTKIQAKGNAASKDAPATVKQPVAANTANPANGAPDSKPANGTTFANAVQHASAANSNGGTQTGSGKTDAAAQMQAAATPVTVTLHTSSSDATTAPAATTPAPVAIPLDAVAVHMARKFDAGESKFEIRLDPAELGKLDITMTVSDDGRVQAVLRAERPETLDMLQRDARLLEGQLRQSGLNVDSNSLSFSLGGGNNQRSGFGNAMPTFTGGADAAPDVEVTAPPTTSTLLTVRDGVDIRI